MQIRRWTLCLVTFVLACGDDGVRPVGGDGDEQENAEITPLTVRELCAVWQSWWDTSQVCRERPLATGLGFDEAAIDRMCRPGLDAFVFATDLLAAEATGRITVDWALARECLTRSRAFRATHPGWAVLTSPDWRAIQDGPCTAFYSGLRADGEACEEDWDCSGAESLCYADAPFSAGGAKCLPPSQVNEPCSGYLPCATGLQCIAGVCQPLSPDGIECADDTECASGFCDPTDGRCATPPEPLAIGDACTAHTDCVDTCMACRPLAAGGATTCQIAAGLGGYCRDRNDCVYDLTCVNGVCGRAADGAACRLDEYMAQGPCGDERYCVHPCVALSGNAGVCEAQGCVWDGNAGLCVPPEETPPTCQALPTQGDCLYGLLCAPGYACQYLPTASCVPAALEGELCDDYSLIAPPCAAGLLCNSVCMFPECETNAECGEAAYCDTTGPMPLCVPYDAGGVCSAEVPCPEGSYCALPPCDWQSETTCNGDAACEWLVDGFCVESSLCAAQSDATSCSGAGCSYEQYCRLNPGPCWDLDGTDQATCEAEPGCAWQAANAWCDPAEGTSCAAGSNAGTCAALPLCEWVAECVPAVICAFLDQAECLADPACQYLDFSGCETRADAQGACAEQLEVGAVCASPEQCLSRDCALDPSDGEYRCAVSLGGCYRTGATLREIFLFGVVWGAWTRRRRRASKP